jgi:hypothetical protein
MKVRPYQVLAGVAVVLFAALLTLAIPSLSDAGFELVNRSSDTVSVVAAWRDQEKDLGTIHPGGSFRFSVSDEAAMTFRVRYGDGREAGSEPIYFTSGVKVMASISDDSVNVRYDFDS